MSITAVIIIFIAGIAAATLIRSWLLRRRVSAPLATGLSLYVLMLSQHPLMQATGSTMSFTLGAIWSAFVTTVIVIIYADSRPK